MNPVPLDSKFFKAPIHEIFHLFIFIFNEQSNDFHALRSGLSIAYIWRYFIFSLNLFFFVIIRLV